MKNVLGIINDVQEENVLKSLTGHRSLASVPFGCRYRLIDFPLSNMTNSGIINVGILLENKFRSLFDHIGPGKAWDLDRKREGLFILPPAQVYGKNRVYKGDIESLYHNLDYLFRSRQDYVIISSSNIICNMNYNQAFKFHKQNEADITAIYQKISQTEKRVKYTYMTTDSNDRVLKMRVKPYRKRYNKVALEKFIMKKDLLIDIIDDCYSSGRWDLLKDGIIGNIDSLKIYGYPYQGYMEHINSVENYFKSSLKLLRPDIRRDIFSKNLIYTKPKDEAPTKFGSSGYARNIMAANGCIIEGEVKNSILFRGVKVKEGARINNSIIMQKTIVGKNARLENVIMDKNSRIRDNQIFKGSTKFPVIIEKNAVV